MSLVLKPDHEMAPDSQGFAWLAYGENKTAASADDLGRNTAEAAAHLSVPFEGTG